jgi:hypothetical protein
MRNAQPLTLFSLFSGTNDEIAGHIYQKRSALSAQRYALNGIFKIKNNVKHPTRNDALSFLSGQL